MATQIERDLKQALYEELRVSPGVGLGAAREKLKIGTPFIYKWGSEDSSFWNRVFANLDVKRALANLSAEEKLYELVEKDDFKAIKLVLQYNNPRYRKGDVNQTQKWEELSTLLRTIHPKKKRKSPKPSLLA